MQVFLRRTIAWVLLTLKMFKSPRNLSSSYIYKISFILCLCILFTGCKPKPVNTIVFSCIKCQGCVDNALRFITSHHIDNKYIILLDTTCFHSEIRKYKFEYSHIENSRIFKQFGKFGNILFYNSIGHRTVLYTNMSLDQYIH